MKVCLFRNTPPARKWCGVGRRILGKGRNHPPHVWGERAIDPAVWLRLVNAAGSGSDPDFSWLCDPSLRDQ